MEIKKSIFWILVVLSVLGVLSVGTFTYNALYFNIHSNDAYYNPVTNQIVISPEKVNYSSIQDVYLHEYAHYIWYQKLEPKERCYYTTIYDNATEFISDYAETNVEEDFAETLRFYLTNIPTPKDRFTFISYVYWTYIEKFGKE
jgi:hypothetical protein